MARDLIFKTVREAVVAARAWMTPPRCQVVFHQDPEHAMWAIEGWVGKDSAECSQLMQEGQPSVARFLWPRFDQPFEVDSRKVVRTIDEVAHERGIFYPFEYGDEVYAYDLKRRTTQKLPGRSSRVSHTLVTNYANAYVQAWKEMDAAFDAEIKAERGQ